MRFGPSHKMCASSMKNKSATQAAYDEAMLELRARKKLAEWLERDEN